MTYQWAPDYSTYIDMDKYGQYDPTWTSNEDGVGGSFRIGENRSGGGQEIRPFGNEQNIKPSYDEMKSAGLWNLGDMNSDTWKFLQSKSDWANNHTDVRNNPSQFLTSLVDMGGLSADTPDRFNQSQGRLNEMLNGLNPAFVNQANSGVGQYLQNYEAGRHTREGNNVGNFVGEVGDSFSDLSKDFLIPFISRALALYSGVGAAGAAAGGGAAAGASAGASAGTAAGMEGMGAGAMQLSGPGYAGVGAAEGAGAGAGFDSAGLMAGEGSAGVVGNSGLETGAATPLGNETGSGLQRMMERGSPTSLSGPASNVDLNTGLVSSATEGPVQGTFTQGDLTSSLVGDPLTMPSMNSIPSLNSLNEPSTSSTETTPMPGTDQYPTEGTNFPGEPEGQYGGPTGMNDPSTMSQLRDLYGTLKDPARLLMALQQLGRGRQQRGAMEEFMRNAQGQAFPHQEFQQFARDYFDPAKRNQMLQNTPGFQASQDYLSKETQRKLAGQGKFSQVGQGGAMSNNWSVPMLDVLGKNAQAWDNQLFGQIKDASGMGINSLDANNRLAGGLLPQMFREENNGYRELGNALFRNMESAPEALKRWLA